jgi:hypothetical protein
LKFTLSYITIAGADPKKLCKESNETKSCFFKEINRLTNPSEIGLKLGRKRHKLIKLEMKKGR